MFSVVILVEGGNDYLDLENLTRGTSLLPNSVLSHGIKCSSARKELKMEWYKWIGCVDLKTDDHIMVGLVDCGVRLIIYLKTKMLIDSFYYWVDDTEKVLPVLAR